MKVVEYLTSLLPVVAESFGPASFADRRAQRALLEPPSSSSPLSWPTSSFEACSRFHHRLRHRLRHHFQRRMEVWRGRCCPTETHHAARKARENRRSALVYSSFFPLSSLNAS